MLKDKQIVMGLKIYEKEATQNKYIKAGKKKGFLGNDVMHARTGLCTHEFICVCKLDHVYIDPYPETLINTETEQKPNKIKNVKSNNLTCLNT